MLVVPPELDDPPEGGEVITVVGGPASATQSLTACSWTSHPGKTVPVLPQDGCTDSAHRRKSVEAEAHEGNIDDACAQWEAHEVSGVVPGQFSLAILSHVEAQEPSTCDDEQFPPHDATLRLSPVSTRTTDPPQPEVNATTRRPKPLTKPFMKFLPPGDSTGASVA